MSIPSFGYESSNQAGNQVARFSPQTIGISNIYGDAQQQIIRRKVPWIGDRALSIRDTRSHAQSIESFDLFGLL
jgi:hypothetical protein